MSAASVTPRPVAKETVCSECGLPWERHGTKATLADCVKLLKAELAKRPALFRGQYVPGVTAPTPFVPTRPSGAHYVQAAK